MGWGWGQLHAPGPPGPGLSPLAPRSPSYLCVPVVAMQGPCLFFVRKIPGLVPCQPRNSAYLSAGKPLDSTRARTHEQLFQRLCWAAEPIQAAFHSEVILCKALGSMFLPEGGTLSERNNHTGCLGVIGRPPPASLASLVSRPCTPYCLLLAPLPLEDREGLTGRNPISPGMGCLHPR